MQAESRESQVGGASREGKVSGAQAESQVVYKQRTKWGTSRECDFTAKENADRHRSGASAGARGIGRCPSRCGRPPLGFQSKQSESGDGGGRGIWFRMYIRRISPPS